MGRVTDTDGQVIQPIFATGLGLQSVLRRVSDDDVPKRLTTLVDDLDETIVQIRSTIFPCSTRTPMARRCHCCRSAGARCFRTDREVDSSSNVRP